MTARTDLHPQGSPETIIARRVNLAEKARIVSPKPELLWQTPQEHLDRMQEAAEVFTWDKRVKWSFAKRKETVRFRTGTSDAEGILTKPELAKLRSLDDVFSDFIRRSFTDYAELIGDTPKKVAGAFELNIDVGRSGQGPHTDGWGGSSRGHWLVQYVAGTGPATVHLGGVLENKVENGKQWDGAFVNPAGLQPIQAATGQASRLTPTSFHEPPEIEEPRLLLRAFFPTPDHILQMHDLT